MAAFEREIFVGFYAIRKLVEGRKISDRLRDQEVSVEEFKPRPGRVATINNAHRVGENFDLERKSKSTIPLKFLCNEVIHSYVFCPAITARGCIQGILVSSDRHRNKRLLFVKIPDIIRVMREVGRNYPAQMHSVFNEKIQDHVWTIN